MTAIPATFDHMGRSSSGPTPSGSIASGKVTCGDVHRHGGIGSNGTGNQTRTYHRQRQQKTRSRENLGGRKPQFTPSQIQNAQRLFDADEPATQVTKDMGMSRTTLYRRIATTNTVQ